MAEEGTPEHLAVSSLPVSANTEDGKHDSGGDLKLSDEGKPVKDVDHDGKTTTPDQDNKSNVEADQPKADPPDTASNKETDVKTMAPPADGSSTPVICSQTNLLSSLNEAGDISHGDGRSQENSKKSLEIKNLTAESPLSPESYSDDNTIAASCKDGPTTSVSGRVSSLPVSANTEDGKHDSGGDLKLSDEGKPVKDVDHDGKTTTPDQDNKSNVEADQPKADPPDTASNKETDVKTTAPPADGSSTPVICSQTNVLSSLNEASDISHGDGRSKENSKKSLEIQNLTPESLLSPESCSDDNTIAASYKDGPPTSVSGRDLPGEGSEASNDRISEAEEEKDGKHEEAIETPNKTHTTAAQTNIKDEEPKPYCPKPVSYFNKDDQKVMLGDGFAASNDRIPEAEEDEEQPKAYSPKPASYPKTDEGNKIATSGGRSTACDDRIPEAKEGQMTWLIAVGIGVIILVLAILVQQLQTQSLPQKHSLNQVDIFKNQMERVKAGFTHQRTELWTRSRIHLLKHLQSAQPTEPVSVILTAGVGAQQTLRCFAKSLASAFSSAQNASVLFIDGHSKAGQNSDQVKLDIDSQLQNAFEGNSQAAVIHRFEELPPGSTLIFYRYCDHENAAYKKPLLVFTVLLGDQREIPADAQFSAVEEMVDDHLQKRFLSLSRPVSFDSMDRDKYGGLWSRISHLILPVAAEETIERKGCERT